MAHQCNEDGYFVYLWLFNEITTLQKLFPLFFVLLVGSSPEFVRKKCLSAFNGIRISIMQIDELMHCLSPDEKTLFERIYFLSWQFFLSKNIWFCRKRKCWKSYFILLRNTEKLRLKYLKLVFNFLLQFWFVWCWESLF